MTIPKPENGLVIRYDFLWGEESRRGHESGKDRPCAIVISSKPNEEGDQVITVAPITHTEPTAEDLAIELHPQTCRRLGLDDERMWIKTDELNLFTWEEGRIPFGITPTSKGKWSYGILPPDTYKKMIESIMEHRRKGIIEFTNRD